MIFIFNQLQGILVVDGDEFDIIPETQIILDKADCFNSTIVPTHSHSVTRTSHTLFPSNTPASVSPETCESLKQLAQQAPKNLGNCKTNQACDTIDCTTLNNYREKFTIVPCDSPPAMHIVIYDPEGGVVYDQLVTNRTEVPLGPFGTRLVVIIDDEPGAMNVQVGVVRVCYGVGVVGYTVCVARYLR